MSSIFTHGPALSDAGADGRSQLAGQANGRSRRGRLRFGRVLLLASLTAIILFGYLAGGFIRFTQDVSALSTPRRVERADGIVVLTGGALRLDLAIGLLKDGRAERLLISGVNPATSIATLSKLTETDRRWFDCCVDLDYAALNTIGNAEMTERWAQSRSFDELILVTSDYHMPRTLLEFEHFTRVKVIRPYPVARADLWADPAVPSGLGLKVLLTEYAKLLAARVRIAASPAKASMVTGVSAAGPHAT
ncbi:MAG: YdcF family protein [Rhizobiaceae bacterium]|nr:YdcF family protein [Rhizobiaceae bacterium]